jgi:hypothetical protein
MNQRQSDRIEELGRAYQEELRRILETGNVEPMMAQAAYQDIEVAPPQECEYPHPQKNISPYPITIKQQHNGFIVEVGCQTFVFETYDKMSKYLKMYFEDPKGMITKHEEGTLFGN